MWYDIVVLVLLVWFTARGASRGLIWQLAGIAGILLCVFFSSEFAAVVGPHVDLEPPLNEWVILFASYLFFTFISFGVARVINRGIEKAEMKEFNRHLGAVFGLLKGGVLCLVLTFFVATLPSMHNAIRESKTGHIAAIVVNKIHPVMPPKLHAALEKYIHSLDDVETGLPPAHDNLEMADPLGYAFQEASKPINTETPWSSAFELLTSATTPPPSTVPQISIPGSSIPLGASRPSQTPTAPAGYRSSIPLSAQRPGTTAATAASARTDQLMTEIQGALGSDVRRRLTETLSNLDPQTRRQLESQIVDLLKQTSPQDLPQVGQFLQQAAGDRLPGMLSSWSNSLAAQPAVSADAESQQLLEEISQLRSTFPQVQSRLQSEVRGLLKGVPSQVQIAVLRDWKSDLSNQPNDPDATTDASTPIEMRILRQMQLSGLRLDSLDADLQDRLSSGAEGGVQLR